MHIADIEYSCGGLRLVGQIAARCGELIDDPLRTRALGQAMADARSWRAMLDLFTEKFDERFC